MKRTKRSTKMTTHSSIIAARRSLLTPSTCPRPCFHSAHDEALLSLCFARPERNSRGIHMVRWPCWALASNYDATSLPVRDSLFYRASSWHCASARCFESLLKTARPSTTLSRQAQIAQCTAVAHCHGGRALQRVIVNMNYRAVHALSFRSALDSLEPQRTSERSISQHGGEFGRDCRVHKQTCRHCRFDQNESHGQGSGSRVNSCGKKLGKLSSQLPNVPSALNHRIHQSKRQALNRYMGQQGNPSIFCHELLQLIRPLVLASLLLHAEQASLWPSPGQRGLGAHSAGLCQTACRNALKERTCHGGVPTAKALHEWNRNEHQEGQRSAWLKLTAGRHHVFYVTSLPLSRVSLQANLRQRK